MTHTTCTRVAEELRAQAKAHLEAADRAHTICDEDTRTRNAAQIRFVASLTGAGHLEMGQAWLTAGARMLEAYNLTDAARQHLEDLVDTTGADEPCLDTIAQIRAAASQLATITRLGARL